MIRTARLRKVQHETSGLCVIKYLAGRATLGEMWRQRVPDAWLIAATLGALPNAESDTL